MKKEQEFVILADEITKAWSGLLVKEYKNYKGLKNKIFAIILVIWNWF